MALTNAERQAAFKARKAETLEALAQQNAALLAEVAELRAEVDRLREKAHRLEIAALKAQISRAEPKAEKAAPAKTPIKRIDRTPAEIRRSDGPSPAIMAITALSSPWARMAVLMMAP